MPLVHADAGRHIEQDFPQLADHVLLGAFFGDVLDGADDAHHFLTDDQRRLADDNIPGPAAGIRQLAGDMLFRFACENFGIINQGRILGGYGSQLLYCMADELVQGEPHKIQLCLVGPHEAGVHVLPEDVDTGTVQNFLVKIIQLQVRWVEFVHAIYLVNSAGPLCPAGD